MENETVLSELSRRGVSRREFLRFCTRMAAVLALPATSAPKIAGALEKKLKPVVIWCEFSDCAGITESLLRANKPSIDKLLLEVISLEYHETLMAAAGSAAEKSKEDAIKKYRGKYLAVVEGAIPMKDGGVYCTIGGKAALSIAREVCGNALATLAVGSCAVWGGIAEAKPNPTGCVGVQTAVPGITLINLPGCAVNVENITATIVYYLTFGAWPALDGRRRPLFGYGIRIHDNCERRAHFDAGRFVRRWGDEGARLGWCLYEVGCKGPQAYYNCPTVRYNMGTSWPVMAGHPCFACAADHNWDAMGPIYSRLPNVPGTGYQASADRIGLGIAAASAAGVAAHAIIRGIRHRRSSTLERSSDAEDRH